MEPQKARKTLNVLILNCRLQRKAEARQEIAKKEAEARQEINIRDAEIAKLNAALIKLMRKFEQSGEEFV